MNNSIERIQIQLDKCFDILSSCCATKVSYVLSQLDLFFIDVEQRSSTFSPESMIKLFLYRRIKGINYYHHLTIDLYKNQGDAFQLGFHNDEWNNLQLPKKQSFNKFFKEKISQETRLFLEDIAKLILKTATERGIVLDIELVKNVIKNHKQHKKKISQKSFKEAIKLVKQLVYPQINIPLHHNATFTTKDLLDALVHVAYTHDFCNNGSKTLKELHPDKQIPSGDTLLHHFNKLKFKGDIQHTFNTILDVILNYAKKNYKILNRRKLDIAYDIHKIPYYGNRSDQYVTESKPDRGTSHFYQFLTCSIVVAGRRFILDVVPIHAFDNVEDLLDKSLERVKKRIRIEKAFLDRGFDRASVINVLKEHKVKFIMPKIRSETVKAWFRKSEDCKSRVIENFEIGKDGEKAIVNLILVDDEEGIKRAFITNFHVPEQLTHYLYSWYSKQWGIETSYRSLDHDFKARTTSKSFGIRLFYFLFSVCLYNLWIPVNICVSLKVLGRISEKPLISCKLFAVILYRVSTEDPPNR